MGIWGKLVEYLLDAAANKRLSAVLLIMGMALVGVGYVGYVWANGQHEELVKQSEFSELQTTVEEGFSKVEEGFEEGRINDSSIDIGMLKLSLQIARATGASENELNRIQDELDHAEEYKACMVRRMPNCKHLREVE